MEIELGQILAKDVTWLQLGTVHLGDGQSLALDFTSGGSKCLDDVPGSVGEGSAISVHVW